MSYWESERIRLRAIDPEDAPIIYEWNRDEEMGLMVKVYGYNEPSQRLHEAMGFMLEGRIRRAVLTDGRYYDDLIYGLIREEFEERYG